MKWTTNVQYVDEATGELLPAKKVENGTYTVKKQIVNSIIKSHYGIKTITKICEPNRQQKLF